jgi:hypothetical protein
MGSGVGAGAKLTDHEPGRTPGGETPPSTAGGTPAATEAWFMESHLFEIDLLTAHEPRNCKSLEINESISRFMGSSLFKNDLLTAHEPRSCKSLEINETISRFMGRNVFQNLDMYWELESGREHRRLSIPTGLRPKARGCEERATPGWVGYFDQPQRGCARPPQPRWGCGSAETRTRGRPAARSNPGLWDGIPLGFQMAFGDGMHTAKSQVIGNQRFDSTVHGGLPVRNRPAHGP